MSDSKKIIEDDKRKGEVKTARRSYRFFEKDVELLEYWAKKEGVGNSEFIVMALHAFIRMKHLDYDVPPLHIERLNQVVDVLRQQTLASERLERTMLDGFDALLGVARGGNYLNDHREDGRL